MQVSDAQQAAVPVGAAGKDEVRGGSDQQERSDRPRSGRGFRRALERARRGSAGGADAHDAASAAAMAGWFRSEPPVPPAAAPTRGGAAAVAGAHAVDRVLIGSGPDGAQARIRIGAGALAGTEIHLSAADGGSAIEARLLTHAATSRQTLSVVMDEIRSRLRDRGIALSTRAPGARAAAPAADPIDGTAGEGGGSAGDVGWGRRDGAVT